MKFFTKKSFAFLMAILMMFALVACGGDVVIIVIRKYISISSQSLKSMLKYIKSNIK